MITKSLLIGIALSMAVFAVKSGIGIHYCLAGSASFKGKTLRLSLFYFLYLMLFLASGQVLAGVDPVKHLDSLFHLVESGMVIHFIMAAMLALWGIHLLRHVNQEYQNANDSRNEYQNVNGNKNEFQNANDSRNEFQNVNGNRSENSRRKSRAWLMLAVPCPVCAMVIFVSLGMLTAFFPSHPMGVTLSLFITFSLMTLLTIGIMRGITKKYSKDSTPEGMLGSAMLFISAYFLLSMTLMPQFAELETVYRLALSSSAGAGPFNEMAGQISQIGLFISLIGTLFTAGFFRKLAIIKKISRRFI